LAGDPENAEFTKTKVRNTKDFIQILEEAYYKRELYSIMRIIWLTLTLQKAKQRKSNSRNSISLFESLLLMKGNRKELSVIISN